jgi:hypothetical protein
MVYLLAGSDWVILTWVEHVVMGTERKEENEEEEGL